jgi:RHS repeat-associated protein
VTNTSWMPQIFPASARRWRVVLGGRHRWLLLTLSLTWLFGPTVTEVRGQIDYLTVIGKPSPDATLPVENGYVDAGTGNLHLEIPLGSFPQRGLPTLTAKLVYDSRIWQLVSGVWQPTNVANSLGGWRFILTGGPGSVSYSTYPWNDGNGNYGNTFMYFTWSAPDGTTHSFPLKTYTAVSNPSPNAQGIATDASGYYMYVTGYTTAAVYAPDGTQVYPSEKDSNGNYFGKDANGNLTDTSSGAPVTARTCGSNTCYDVWNSQWGLSTYTVKTQSVSVSTNFAQPSTTEDSGSFAAISEVDLPDNSKYQFTYDSGTSGTHYGTLSTMTLPTGATITYQFTNFSDAYGNHNMWLITRSISGTGITAGTWTYTPQVNTTCTSGGYNCHQQLTVTAPSTDTKVYMFNLNGGAHAYEIDSNTGSSTLLASITHSFDYSQSCPPLGLCVGPGAAFVSMTASTTTLPIPNSTNISKTTKYTWDTTTNNGNVMKTQEWNFYTGTLPSSPDRTTSTSFLNSSDYTNRNIYDRPTVVWVTDKNGTTIAESVYCYDSTSPGCPAPSFSSATGRANHDDVNYPAGFTFRGDLTKVSRYFNVADSRNNLATLMTYDMTGQMVTSTDSNGNQTTYSYADNFFDDNGQNPPGTHTSSSPPMGGFATSITPALSSVPASTFGYYAGSRKLAKFTDPNGNSQYFHFVDPLDRPSATAVLDNSSTTRGWTLTQYNSADTQVDSYLGITGTSSSGCSNCRHNQAVLDALGRVISNRLVNDPDGETYSDMTFDSTGRVATISNPYRTMSDPTYGLETPYYDGLDRTYQVKHADNNIAHMYYGASVGTNGGASSQLCSSSYGLGYPVLIVDEAGNKRQTWTDGFGRVVETDEPGSSGSLTVGTCYSYDLNNNLTQVTSLGLTQTQKPTYTYDMLSRITSKTLPGTGTTCYYYTTSGGTCGGTATSGTLCSGDPSAVCRRTDARSVTTTYSYDALNRLTTKAYSDGTLTAYYYYDQSAPWGYALSNYKGRMTSMGTNNGTSWIALSCLDYDPLGHVSHKRDQVVVGTNTISEDSYYTYNLDGSIASIKYPSGRTVTYTEGNAQRMTSAADTANNINYTTSATYAPQGALATMQNGSSVVSTMFYNSRLELCRISVKNTGTAPANCSSTTAGNVLDLAYGYVSGNNGNIAAQTNNVTNGRTQNYTYDPLNRLLTAQTQATSGGDCWGQSFGNNGPPPTLAADALANLFYTTATQCSAPQPRFQMNTSNNDQFTASGIGYDSDGDTTTETINPYTYTYTYDAENRISTVSGMPGGAGPYCYTYDVFGVRVMKSHANGGSCTGTVTVDMLYWRDTSGNTIAETDGTGSTIDAYYNEYVFFAGRRIAQSNPASGSVYYYFVDQLGSTRVVTTATGTACYEVDYLPYGTENTPSGFSNACSTRYRFTGYERDLETALGTSAGNDYAFARYYNQLLQRFMSGDPLDGDISDPQTLNMYSYVGNNPINLVDPAGMNGQCDQNGCSDTVTGTDPGSGWGPGPGIGGSNFPLNCQFSPACLAGWRANINKEKRKPPQTTPSQAPQQKYDSCMASFNNSTAGKVVQFGSVLSFASNFWDTAKNWGEAIFVKGSYFKVAEMAGQSLQPAGEITPVTTVAKPLVADLATGGIALATLTDAGARSVCTQAAYPYMNRMIY